MAKNRSPRDAATPEQLIVNLDAIGNAGSSDFAEAVEPVAEDASSVWLGTHYAPATWQNSPVGRYDAMFLYGPPTATSIFDMVFNMVRDLGRGIGRAGLVCL
jgi:hypothetical protein